MPTRLLRALVFCAVFSLTITNAHGQTKDWIGPYPGYWNTAANWSPNNGLPPGPTDDVVIYHQFGDIVTLNSGTATINSLTVGGSYVYGVSSVLAGDGLTNLSIMHDLTIGQTGDLELRAGDVINHFGNQFLNLGFVHVGPGAQLNIANAAISTIYDGAIFDIEGSLTQSYFANLATIQPAGALALMNGENWLIHQTSNALANSGALSIGNYTQLIIEGAVENTGLLETFGGNSYLEIDGVLTNDRSPFGGTFEVGNTDLANVFGLTNNSYVTVDTGGTLNLAWGHQPGIPDIPANSGFAILGTFNQTYYGANPSAFYDLTSIEGGLLLGNGQTTDITPTGGTLTSTSGYLNVSNGSTLNIHGTLNNSDALSVLDMFDSGTVVNVDNLNNNGLVWIHTGATLFLLNQPNGITTIPAISQFELDGACYAGANTSAPSCFSKLDTINGALVINNGQTIQDNPSSGTLTIASSGSLTVLNGSTFKVHSNIVGNYGANIFLDPSVLEVDGTFFNNGANVTIGANSVFQVGTMRNGGPLMLTHNTGMTVSNGFYQLASGTLGESIDATGFSIVTVNGGPVVLDGSLDVLLGPNFNPTIGSFYKFLLFGPGELNGVFASIQNDYFNRGPRDGS